MTQNNDPIKPPVLNSHNCSESTTIERLEHCANCNVKLNGKFCHSCGQSSKSMIKFFGEVAKELLDDALGYDSRLKHSIVPLIFKPGRMTMDYIKGKRFYYVLPFKLYLITSVLFILLIKMTANTDELKFKDGSETDQSQKSSEVVVKEVTDEVAQELSEINHVNDNPWIPQIVIDRKQEAPESELVLSSDSSESSNHDNTIQAEPMVAEDKKNVEGRGSNGDNEYNLSWDDEKQQLTGFETIEDGWIKTFLTVINPKIKVWKKNAGPLVKDIIELLPYMMFIILPIFAIFLKGFYIFSKRYYTEHLIFLLHNHSFIYVMLMVQIVLGVSHKKLLLTAHWSTQFAAETLDWLSTIIGVWIVVYVFLAMKRFYLQSWVKTISKTMALSVIYFIMLSIGFLITIAYGAYQA